MDYAAWVICDAALYQNCWQSYLGRIVGRKGKYLLDAVGLSGILKVKQKLGVTFNFDKQDVINFMKFSKMTMCRASEANSEK